MCTGIHSIPSGPAEFPEAVYSFVICDEKNVMIDAGVANSVTDVGFWIDWTTWWKLTSILIT